MEQADERDSKRLEKTTLEKQYVYITAELYTWNLQ